jgi:hypothetical protein
VPKISERYFPVAQKINRDPEVRQLKRDLGLTGFSMWLQVLAETDGQKGLWKGSAMDIGGVLAGVCESNTRGSARFLQWVTDRVWIVWQSGSGIDSWWGLIVHKHAKYHSLKNEKESEEENEKSPSLPNLPNLPSKKNHKNDSYLERESAQSAHAPAPEVISPFREFTDYYCRSFEDHFQQKYAFAKAKDGQSVKRILAGPHSIDQILELIKRFFESDDAWIRDTGYTITAFESQINKLAINNGKQMPKSKQALHDWANKQRGDGT